MSLLNVCLGRLENEGRGWMKENEGKWRQLRRGLHVNKSTMSSMMSNIYTIIPSKVRLHYRSYKYMVYFKFIKIMTYANF